MRKWKLLSISRKNILITIKKIISKFLTVSRNSDCLRYDWIEKRFTIVSTRLLSIDSLFPPLSSIHQFYSFSSTRRTWGEHDKYASLFRTIAIKYGWEHFSEFPA